MNKCAYSYLLSHKTCQTDHRIFTPRICSRGSISNFYSKNKPIYQAFSQIRGREHNKTITALSSEPILEGDLLIFRTLNDKNWSIGAVIEMRFAEFLIRPIYSRNTESTNLVECFVNWDPTIQSQILRYESHEIQLLDVDYEERVVQDRLENPHGEVSEDCWRVSSNLLEQFKIKIHSL